MAGLQVTDISNVAGDGPVDLAFQSAAKAWAKWGTDAVADGSQNVSSITDHSTGRFSTAFASAMADANYSGQVNGQWTVGTDNGLMIYTGDNGDITASNFKMAFYNTGSNFYDVDEMSNTIHGDLA